MKLYRRYCLFLIFLSLLIPLNVAYLYFDYYSEIELQVRKNLSAQEEESLLLLFKKNPRIIYLPGASVQNQLFSPLEIFFLPPCGSLAAPSQNPVLRC